MTQADYYLQEKHNETWEMSRFHFHDYFELFLPLTSTGSIFVNDRAFPLQQDHLYLIGKNTLHRTTSSGHHARYILHMSEQSLVHFSTRQTDFKRLAMQPFLQAKMSEEQVEEILQLFERLLLCENDGTFGQDIAQTMALLEILIFVTPIFNQSTEDSPVLSKDFLRISPMLDYIQENLSEQLNLDQMASAFFISKSYLCRIFKSATGFTVMEYTIHNRILKARQLLQEGHSVQRAGELSGFSDNSHFIRTFGNLTGMSPGRYSKEYQGSDQVSIGNG
ncbi:MAG: AraC family transcriptional regulator [Eubacteriales bacterium]